MSSERTKERKEWRKPELTVLVRNKPEEAVLAGCKSGGQGGPDISDGTCTNTVGCGDCSAKVQS